MAVPKLRFPGFTDDWEQRKLSEVAEFSKGNGYSKGDLCDVGTPIILYGRLYTKYETSISEVDTFAIPKSGSVYSKGGEVIVPASGETAEDIARAATVENAGILLGGDLNVVTPSKDINSAFLALSISNGEPQKELAKKAQGKSVVHIHNEEIKGLEIAFPEREEQDRISAYFSNLDNLITLHQCECNELQELKKSMLQKMFPKAGKTVPEIRFPGFDGEWERIPLRNVTTQSLDKNSKNQDIPVYSVTNHSGFIPQEDTFVNGEVASQNKKTYRIVKKNQFAYNPTRINVGSIDYLRDIEKVIVSPLYVVFMCNDNVDPAFIKLFSLTNDFKNQRQDNTEVGVRDTLKYDRFSNILISLPSLKEQQKIGSFFKEIDNRIELQKQLLDEIKEYKKGLLQQMFC